MQTLRVKRAQMRVLLLAAGLCLAMLVPGERPVQALAPTAATVTVTMSNPTCVQASPNSGTCQITFNSASATGSDTSFSYLEVSVDGKLRARMQGFFQSGAYMSAEMLGSGLQVACGRPNAGGKAGYGKSHILQVTGFMSAGENGFGQATVFCPYYDGKTFIPLVTR